MPTRSKRRPARPTKLSKSTTSSSKAANAAAATRSHHFLTNSEGQRRAIILDMNYYLKLLGELHTLRAQAKQRGATAGSSKGRRSSR